VAPLARSPDRTFTSPGTRLRKAQSFADQAMRELARNCVPLPYDVAKVCDESEAS
jgi:hypothetical protein